ncbi:MAG: glycosyl hydrolase, partial [Verrucomicrobia bacterium]|nr:glycosyl hydrolase [Verrucomicrobiota bacterium]
MGTLTPRLRAEWSGFYRDVCVLAFPTPKRQARIADIDEKALYYRAPYSSQPDVKPRLPAPAQFPPAPLAECIASNRILDLTGKLSPDGRLEWSVPSGRWTILRFGRRSTGQVTRPAPLPGLGFECDKFDAAALDAHFNAYVGRILAAPGPRRHPGRGITTLHFDSWEMSSQNWTKNFREAFEKRRGYDPLRFLPVLTGRIVEGPEASERFLWDLRRTAQELVVKNCAQRLRKLAHRHGLVLSMEPYDMNPAGDLALGSAADVPMGEFWAQDHGFHTEYSCLEAVSLGHTLDRRIIGAESFTAAPGEDWRLCPGTIKAQADWAFCAGINRLVIHRYAAQPWLDRRPGMTMGPYGVHWERTQTWWSMVPAFHRYLARCQMMLRRGLPVADILYLDAEGAPDVFRPPASALLPGLPDRRGYNFDGCGTDTLVSKAAVRNDRIVFPGGMSYRVLVLPELQTMTPRLLRKIRNLVRAGATVIGAPPQESPSLQNYPRCDAEVKRLAAQIWGSGALQSE